MGKLGGEHRASWNPSGHVELGESACNPLSSAVIDMGKVQTVSRVYA